VPFVEPRSSISKAPFALREMRACLREISMSSPSRPSPSVERPISSSSSTSISAPAALPSVTLSFSLSIGTSP
jgi:hypothetical protein